MLHHDEARVLEPPTKLPTFLISWAFLSLPQSRVLIPWVVVWVWSYTLRVVPPQSSLCCSAECMLHMGVGSRLQSKPSSFLNLILKPLTKPWVIALLERMKGDMRARWTSTHALVAAEALHKPLVVEEFGKKVPPNAELQDMREYRDPVFRSVYASVEKSAERWWVTSSSGWARASWALCKSLSNTYFSHTLLLIYCKLPLIRCKSSYRGEASQCLLSPIMKMWKVEDNVNMSRMRLLCCNKAQS